MPKHGKHGGKHGGKGKKGKMEPWVRQWRRHTAVHTLLEDNAYFEYNLAKSAFNQVLNQHRPHLRRVKRRELHEAMRQEALHVEQEIDRRGDMLHFLMNDMREAFEQEEGLARRHTAALNRLVEMHDDLRKFMEEEFYGSLRTLLAELCAKTNMLSKQNDEDMRKLEVMKKILDEEWAEEETERRTKFLTSLDEIKNRIMEEKQILRIQMEQVISDLYQKMEDEYIKYRNRTEEKLVRYQELRAKDEISSKEVKYQVMRINMLSQQVTMRKAKLANFRRTAEIKMRYWEQLKGRLKAVTGLVKRRIRLGNARFQNAHREMTLNFQSVHDQLFDLEKLGVRLVRNALACHRMQTPDDKLYASSSAQPTKEEQANLERMKARVPKFAMNESTKDIARMGPCLMNNAHMELKNIARTYEVKELNKQNSKLEELIKDYIKDKTVTDDILRVNNANPLLNITGPTYVVVDRWKRRLHHISHRKKPVSEPKPLTEPPQPEMSVVHPAEPPSAEPVGAT